MVVRPRAGVAQRAQPSPVLRVSRQRAAHGAGGVASAAGAAQLACRARLHARPVRNLKAPFVARAALLAPATGATIPGVAFMPAGAAAVARVRSAAQAVIEAPAPGVAVGPVRGVRA